MADVTDLLILAVKDKIEGLNTGFNVWTKFVPSTEAGNLYYQIGAVYGNDAEPVKGYRRRNYNLTISLFCRDTTVDVDIIAGQVSDAIYDESNKCLLSIDGYQLDIIGINDVSPDAIQFNDVTFINRYLTYTISALKV